jgi:hypothetical protein
MRKNRSHADPILDNAYNTGTVEIESFSSLKVDEQYAVDYMGSGGNMYDDYRLDALMDGFYSTFTESKYGKIYTGKNEKKKIPKSSLPAIFEELKSSIEDESYSNCEVFTCISDFLGISPKVLWESIHNSYQEEILNELREYDPSIVGKLGMGMLF